MLIYTGKTVFKGIAIGNISFHKKKELPVERVKIADTEAEIKRYEVARQTAAEQLQELYRKALQEAGRENAAIFEMYSMMLEDHDFVDSVVNMIKTKQVNAEYAVAVTGDKFSGMFAGMEDDYLRARAADVKDISERLVSILKGSDRMEQMGTEPVIVVADELTPSETVRMDKDKLLGFVTKHGSVNSHTAILARSMNIPALTGVDIEPEWNGKPAVVDGYTGTLYIEPDQETLLRMQARRDKNREAGALLQQLKGKEDVTPDGRHICLYANIGSVKDVADVLENDAAGIGLFRSEFLYLESEDYPGEEQQFQAYKTVAEAMAGKKVIIRTLDIGADKQADYFQLEKEENPAMGYRAIRICLDRPEIFKTQLRAIFRASAYGNLSIMYPMIISVDEVLKIKEISKAVREELKAEGFPVGDVEEGIMIETPAAAIMSDELAKHVDFFSIGTNDLTQYTLAIDRQNAKLEPFYDAHHPALLRLIQMVIENSHKAGIWTGICGELGADTELTETFVKMGIDELSVAPGAILPVRKAIRAIK